MKSWWEFNFFWLLMFAIGVLWIMVRKVDGAGVAQNDQTRLISLLVLAAFAVLIIICQSIIFIVMKKRAK